MDILIYGPIGSMWWAEDCTTAVGIAEALRDVPLTEKVVNIRLNTPGGYVSDGLAIRNQLRAFAGQRRLMDAEFKLNTIVDGFAYSAGSIIMLAGDKIVMNTGSIAMIHRAAGMIEGNAEELRKYADYLDTIDKELVSLYATRTGKKSEDIRALLDAETYMRPDEALALGFIDQIEETVAANFGPYEALKNLKPGEYKRRMAQFAKEYKGKPPSNTGKPNPVEYEDLSWIDRDSLDIELLKMSL